MYATLENRETHSLLALNALKVHKAMQNKEHARPWAALFILSSTVTTLDYLAGTAWRLPASIISIPLLIMEGKTQLPTLKELFISAAKAMVCAIGILIFPLIGIFSPEKALALIEKLRLVKLPEESVEEPQIPIPTPRPRRKKKKRLVIDLSKSNYLSHQHTVNIIPDGYENKNLVRKRNENWEKVSKLKISDVNIRLKHKEDPEKTVDMRLFPVRWNTSEKGFSYLLQRGKINGHYLWQHVADMIHIPHEDRDHAEVMKEIIRTLYRLSRKPQPSDVLAAAKEPVVAMSQNRPQIRVIDLSPDNSPRRVSIPRIDMDVWDKLADIKQEDLVFRDPAEGKYTPGWNGPVFLATYLDEWEEIEIKRCLEKTLFKGEPLLDVVTKRLGINKGKKRLKVIEDIIHKVYPMDN